MNMFNRNSSHLELAPYGGMRAELNSQNLICYPGGILLFLRRQVGFVKNV